MNDRLFCSFSIVADERQWATMRWRLVSSIDTQGKRGCGANGRNESLRHLSDAAGFPFLNCRGFETVPPGQLSRPRCLNVCRFAEALAALRPPHIPGRPA